jgi:hypothetical protein
MVPPTSRLLSVSAAAALIAACGGGGSSGSTMTAPTTTTPVPRSSNVGMSMSDASTEEWATIGVSQDGGSNIIVYTAPATAPMVNLTRAVIKDFSPESALPGKSVRIAARHQRDGTPLATRIWASVVDPSATRLDAQSIDIKGNAIHGVPQADGTVKSYVPTYFTGQTPAQ